MEGLRRSIKPIEVMAEVSIGKQGVHIACASLEHIGASASIVEQQGFDVVAVYKSEIYRVEVKATGTMYGSRYPFMTCVGSKKTRINNSHCDIVALVDIIGRRCYYMTASDIVHLKTSLYNHDFTDEFLLFTNAVKKVNRERER